MEKIGRGYDGLAFRSFPQVAMINGPLREIYPNPAQKIGDSPVMIFRDHRWTLPVLYLAGQMGRLELPARLVTFDRHRDSLPPDSGRDELTRWRRNPGGLEELIRLVRDVLSPRDDDWILSGMELGLISGAVRFGTEPDGMETVTRYTDGFGVEHRVFHLERPARELSWKGAFAGSGHSGESDGPAGVLPWDPETRTVGAGRGGLLLDFDLDFFTIGWDLHVFPFSAGVYNTEFFVPCQAAGYDDLRPAAFLREIVRASGAVSIACEPAFCGGASNAGTILEDLNRFLLGSALDLSGVRVDYPAVYPDR